MPYRYHRIDRESLVAFARELVKTPSPSTREGAVAQLVAEEMRRLGFHEVRVDRLGNVLGHLGQGGGKELLLDAHMDTVGATDRTRWSHDPFGAEIEDGILYGRGACDMKGALAAMIYAGKALVESGVEMDGRLTIAAVVQEEPCEGAALRHVLEEEGVHPDWVLLGEATGLQLSRGHRGRIEFQITVHGRSCHAASPQRGVNAIYDAARVIVGLELLAPQLASDSFLGKGSIAVTEISSEAGSRNAVPDACTLVVDRRLTNGETEAKALAELRRIVARESVDATIEIPEYRGQSYTGEEIRARQHFPYWATPANDPFLLKSASVVEEVLGFVPHMGAWDFSTDGTYTSGVAGIPTIGFGPGEERFAHAADERVPIEDLASAAQVYAQLAATMLETR